MNDASCNPIASRPASPPPVTAAAGLFTWQGAGIVLIGTHEDERWVLARGWLQADRMAHVRRWSFSQPTLFSRQVRRLVVEAHGDAGDAREEALRALTWAESAGN